jgi:hypothetical protein
VFFLSSHQSGNSILEKNTNVPVIHIVVAAVVAAVVSGAVIVAVAAESVAVAAEVVVVLIVVVLVVMWQNSLSVLSALNLILKI